MGFDALDILFVDPADTSEEEKICSKWFTSFVA
jgi:hypothetical protein